ncbi:MAG: hypothetical protein ACLGHV_11880, partial [Gammaproteobacteria bacterium]
MFPQRLDSPQAYDIAKAMMDVRPSQLADGKLFDFLALGREGLGHRHRGVLGAAPRAGGALAPGLGLRVEVVQIGEGASGE